MPRKGNKKVRTGCFTCKVRKVKCDEARPSCMRCTSTGRACDGYPIVPASKQRLSLVVTGGVNATGYHDNETRGLEFFHHVAGPGLSGLFNDEFWSRLVLQISHREPAVQHALMAISSLYDPKTQQQQDSSPVQHYNAAIQHMVGTSDGTLAIAMAVLFTCLEFMQGNAPAALSHCGHGIMIFNSLKSLTPAMRQTLLPILTRLSVFQFFFGGDTATMPQLNLLHTLVLETFNDTTEAHSALQALLVQTIRFVRTTDEFRLGAKRQDRIPLRYFAEQHRIRQSLNAWKETFTRFRASRKSAKQDVSQLVLLEMGSRVASIWLDTTLNRTEVGFDEHNALFGEIVELASQLRTGEQVRTPAAQREKFSFDMCFLPLLYFVAIKCRVIELRVAALAYMTVLAREQEGLWKTSTLAQVGQRLIEIEHGIDMNDRGTWTSNIPAEEDRVRECMLDPGADVSVDSEFTDTRANRITCIMWKEPDELYTRDEWLVLPGERRQDYELASAYSEAVSSFPGFLKQMIGPLGLWTQVV